VMTWHRLGLVAVFACVTVSVGACGSGDADMKGGDGKTSASAPGTTGGRWGSYPAYTSLDERSAVKAYVKALDTRNGARFCAVVAPWISGRFDIVGTDPDAPLTRPMRCPQLVANLIGYIEDCCPAKFVGASIERMGQLRRRGAVVGVPITVSLRLDKDEAPMTKTLADVVWVTKDAGAWRVAKLSQVAAAASIRFQSEGDLTTPPNVAAERRAFAAEVATADRQRHERSQAYRQVETTAACPRGTRYRDMDRDVVDYRHPAPPTPTPQLPAADIRAVQVRSADGRICVVFEMAGKTRGLSTFEFALQSPDFDWGGSGFAQSFEVELRADGRARVTSGRDDQGHWISVPGTVGLAENRLMLVVDQASFAAGQPLPGSEAPSRPLAQFDFRADVTLALSERRYLHDDLPELPERLSYR
jgi:hypothetical protein